MEELIINAPEGVSGVNLRLVSTSVGQQATIYTFEHVMEYGVYYQYNVSQKGWRKVVIQDYVPNP